MTRQIIALFPQAATRAPQQSEPFAARRGLSVETLESRNFRPEFADKLCCPALGVGCAAAAAGTSASKELPKLYPITASVLRLFFLFQAERASTSKNIFCIAFDRRLKS